MAMYNPPHPGEFIKEIYIQPFALSARQVAKNLGVSPSTFSRLLSGQSNVSPEMALNSCFRFSNEIGKNE